MQQRSIKDSMLNITQSRIAAWILNLKLVRDLTPNIPHLVLQKSVWVNIIQNWKNVNDG